MRVDRYKTTTVGLVITIALILAAVAILTLGREQGFFRDRATYVTDFPNVDGLAVGAPVRLIGVQVGVVTRIKLPVDIDKQEVDVEFAVDRSYSHRIREGTTATLKNLTYLSGEKYVEVKPGNPAAPLIPEGGYIDSPRSEVEQIIAQGQTIATNVESISTQLNELLSYLNEGDSVLSRLVKDPSFGEDAVDEATRTLANLSSITGSIRNGEGLLGRLLMDEAYGEEMTRRMASVVERLDAVTAKVEAGEGFLGQLLLEDSELIRLQAEASSLVASLGEVAEQLRSGEGLAGKLLMDRAYGETMAARVDALVADLGDILRKIDEGQGTLGRMINEPELYDQATDVVGGLSDRRFLKWVARRVRNKEIKDKIEIYVEELEQAEKAGRP